MPTPLNLPLNLPLLLLPTLPQLRILLLLLHIPLHHSLNTAHRPLGTVANRLPPRARLLLRLLLLAGLVLLLAALAQVFVADQVAQGFFAGADGLVPGWVVLLAVVVCGLFVGGWVVLLVG